MHYIYRITDQISDKIYIGQSNNHRRWSQHRYFAKNPERSGQYIHYAMAKYGIENFIFEVIATCKTQEDANETESKLILQYDSQNKEHGYNSKIGGIKGSRCVLSEEIREKFRQAMIRQISTKGHPAQGTKRTPEQSKRLSEARRNHPVEYTPEIRKRMSDAHIGKTLPEEQRKKLAAAIQADWDKRNAERFATGKIKCNAPDCEIYGKAQYKIINGIRYCNKHGLRLLRTGLLELQPRSSHNKGVPMTEVDKEKAKLTKLKNGTWCAPMTEESKEKAKLTKLKNGTWCAPMTEEIKEKIRLTKLKNGT